MYKFEKSKMPDSGTYDSVESFHKTQKNKIKFNMSKANIVCYFDEKAKRTIKNPGIGHYKVQPSVFSKLSSSPQSIKVKRH